MGLYELTVTRGVATASKCVILDSNKNVTGLVLTNATIQGAGTGLTGGTITNGTLAGSVTYPPAIVAATGTVIANAAPLTGSVNVVTGANSAAGVVLPANVAGLSVTVYNPTNSQTLKVYPPVNSAINNGTPNTAITLAANKAGEFVCSNATDWLYFGNAS